jgi:HSP20 family protein
MIADYFLLGHNGVKKQEVFKMLRQAYGLREFERLQRDMDRMFEASFPFVQRQRGTDLPAINIWANKNDGIVVTSELPGFGPDDIDITVIGNTLTLAGRRQSDEPSEQIHYHRRERGRTDFARTIQLPYSVNPEGVEAALEQGVLRVFLPRAEAEKPKQITIKSGR